MSSSDRKQPGFPEDLSIRARRGLLSVAEQAEFERQAQTSATLRVAHDVGRDFDRISAVRRGDEDLVARCLAAVAARPRLTPRAVSRRLRWGVLAAAIAVPGLAIGGYWLSSRAPVETGDDAERRPALAASSISPPQGVEPPTAQEPASEPSTLGPPVVDSRPKVASPAEPMTSDRATTAADLFRRASAERREGNLARARALFLELQRRFPDSHEARLSQVSLGKLLLATGRADEALRHFDEYLGGGESALAEEARVGRAQAFAALGRRAEEARVWRELLRQHPRSVYVTRAQQRLAELDSSAQ